MLLVNILPTIKFLKIVSTVMYIVVRQILIYLQIKYK